MMVSGVKDENQNQNMDFDKLIWTHAQKHYSLLLLPYTPVKTCKLLAEKIDTSNCSEKHPEEKVLMRF